MNLLFICEKNLMRSRTAEMVYNSEEIHTARSAGTDPYSKVKVTSELLHWADMIFVMEEEQNEFLSKEFQTETWFREIVVLDIHDYYYFMEPELIEMIKGKVESYLQ